MIITQASKRIDKLTFQFHQEDFRQLDKAYFCATQFKGFDEASLLWMSFINFYLCECLKSGGRYDIVGKHIVIGDFLIFEVHTDNSDNGDRHFIFARNEDDLESKLKTIKSSYVSDLGFEKGN